MHTAKDIQFMREACWCCDTSTCITKTGCVVVKDGEIILKGWNQVPNGQVAKNPDEERDLALHSEAVALLEAKKSSLDLANALLYVTRFPCLKCAQLIADAKVDKVFYMSDSFKDGNSAQEFFYKQKIEITQIAEEAVWRSYLAKM